MRHIQCVCEITVRQYTVTFIFKDHSLHQRNLNRFLDECVYKSKHEDAASFVSSYTCSPRSRTPGTTAIHQSVTTLPARSVVFKIISTITVGSPQRASFHDSRCVCISALTKSTIQHTRFSLRLCFLFGGFLTL